MAKKILSLAHRGFSGYYPENTRVAFEAAVEKTNCDGFESDVHFSKDGKLVITQEGAKKKFVKQVEHITFSGDYANEVHQPVLYITERAVFELRPEGVTLIEIAPGIDMQTQVLDQMDFVPKIADEVKLMDARIFREEKMGLAND